MVDPDNYIATLAITPRDSAVSAGVVEITAHEIRFDLLDASGARVNPNAVNVALRTTQGLPANNTVVLADIEASLPV